MMVLKYIEMDAVNAEGSTRLPQTRSPHRQTRLSFATLLAVFSFSIDLEIHSQRKNALNVILLLESSYLNPKSSESYL